MGIHCGLRDKFGSVVKNEAFVFQLEALFQTVFNGLGPDPEVSFPEWGVMQEKIQQLAMLHRQEVEVDQALAEALSTQSYVLETRKLLLDLLATTPAALLQAQADPAGAVHAVDAALWLRWWKDPQSWTAGCSFQQWCKDKPVLESSKKASTTARKLTGPQPANVAQAVVWQLQARNLTTEHCDAANDAVRTLQSKLANVQQQQEEAYAQLQQGWQKVLSSAFAPQQHVLAMQQELAASQAQLAAAVQEVAAARAQAEAAELELQQRQQQKPLAVTLTVQQPSIVLQVTLQDSDRGCTQLEASKQPAMQAALAAMLSVQQLEQRQENQHPLEQQPDTPQEWQQQGLLPPALRLLDNSPCISSNSSSGSTSHTVGEQGAVQQGSAVGGHGVHGQAQCAGPSAAGQQSQQGNSDTAQSVGDCEAHAGAGSALSDQHVGALSGHHSRSHSPCGSVNSSTRRPKFVSETSAGWGAGQNASSPQQQQEPQQQSSSKSLGGLYRSGREVGADLVLIKHSRQAKGSSSKGSAAPMCSDTASAKVAEELNKSQGSSSRNQTTGAVRRPWDLEVPPPPPVCGINGSVMFMAALDRRRNGLDWLQVLR